MKNSKRNFNAQTFLSFEKKEKKNISDILIASSFLLVLAGILFISSFFVTETNQIKAGKINIVTTTSILADNLKQIYSPYINIICLMDAEVDPHTYRPVQKDKQIAEKADLIIFGGLHLEGGLEENTFFQEEEKKGKLIRAASPEKVKEYLKKLNRDIIEDKDDKENSDSIVYDPHIWFDLDLWQNILIDLYKKINEKIKPLISKQQFNQININIEQYVGKKDKEKKIVEQEQEQFSQFVKCKEDLKSILKSIIKQYNNKNNFNKLEEKQEITVITAHDAFSYYQEFLNQLLKEIHNEQKEKSIPIFNLKVENIQGISTASEKDKKRIKNLAQKIIDQNINYIFSENSVADSNINEIINEAKKIKKNEEILICPDELCSDALGKFNNGLLNYNYLDMMKTNTIIIFSYSLNILENKHE